MYLLYKAYTFSPAGPRLYMHYSLRPSYINWIGPYIIFTKAEIPWPHVHPQNHLSICLVEEGASISWEAG